MAGWEDPYAALPPEVFSVVLQCLTEPGGWVVGVLTARAVCRAWLSAVMSDAAVWRQMCMSRVPLATVDVAQAVSSRTRNEDDLLVVPAQTYAIGSLGVLPDRWAEACRSSRDYFGPLIGGDDDDYEEEEEEEVDDEHHQAKDITEWYTAFKLTRDYLSWDPDAMSPGLQIEGPRGHHIHHTDSKHGYRWARSRSGFSQGVHRWRVVMQTYSRYAGVGAFPQQYDDWQSTAWVWKCPGGYFYQPFIPSLLPGTDLEHPRNPEGPVFSDRDTVIVDVVLDMNARTIQFNAKSFNTENRLIREATNTVALLPAAAVLFPAILAGTVGDRFTISAAPLLM